MTQGLQDDAARPPDLSVLSDREREVLELIAQGMRTSEIAARLNRAVPTIKSHRQQIGRKLGARTRVDLARIAFEAYGGGDDAHRHAVAVLAEPSGPACVVRLLTGLADVLGVEGALVALDDGPGRVRVIEHVRGREAGWTGELLTTEGPFAGDFAGSVCHGPRARDEFPGAADLRALGASFITGARVVGRGGRSRGLLIAYDRSEIVPRLGRCSIVSAFAARLGAEIEDSQGG